jgi:hypothetical protein
VLDMIKMLRKLSMGGCVRIGIDGRAPYMTGP